MSTENCYHEDQNILPFCSWFIASLDLIGLIFESVHAFGNSKWGRRDLPVWFMLLNEPDAIALILTCQLGAVLLATEVIRCVVSFAYR